MNSLFKFCKGAIAPIRICTKSKISEDEELMDMVITPKGGTMFTDFVFVTNDMINDDEEIVNISYQGGNITYFSSGETTSVVYSL